ncbi:MAG: HNH endonuclease signature motif containing protein [bacterium]
MPLCSKCHAQVSFVGRLSFNNQTGLCGKCDKEVRSYYNYFRRLFIEFCQDAILSPAEWLKLQDVARDYHLDWQGALVYVRGDALNFMERQLAFAAADGMITQEEETNFRNWQLALNLPVELMRPTLERLNYLRAITRIREGNLPVIKPQIHLHLESDEICHLDKDATYHRVNAKSVTYVPGRLVATSKRLNFLSPLGGWDIQWKRIMRIEPNSRGIYLELSTKKGNGHYDLADTLLAEAVITTVVRMNKRELVISASDLSRRIPHDVKVSVWQRDQAKCVQCGAPDYLEFDHDIPFSKGGANTVGNIRLLCRRCNLAKGNRI